MAKIEVNVELPDALVQPFLQHVRDFDARHMNEVQMRMWITQTNLTPKEIEAVFRNLQPPFEFFHQIKFS